MPARSELRNPQPQPPLASRPRPPAASCGHSAPDYGAAARFRQPRPASCRPPAAARHTHLAISSGPRVLRKGALCSPQPGGAEGGARFGYPAVRNSRNFPFFRFPFWLHPSRRTSLMAALASLRVVVPQIDITRALSSSQPASSVGDKAFFGVPSSKQLFSAVAAGEKPCCRVPAIGNVRATAAASKVVKDKPKSGEKADKSQLVGGFTQFDRHWIRFSFACIGFPGFPLLLQCG